MRAPGRSRRLRGSRAGPRAPRTAQEGVRAGGPGVRDRDPRGAWVRVLIAEDDAVSRTILRRSVEKLGHECLAAEDGEAALALYRNTPGVDLVISDWMMPGIDGPALCRLIREDKRDDYTYFIFLTALGDKRHLLAS